MGLTSFAYDNDMKRIYDTFIKNINMNLPFNYYNMSDKRLNR